MGLLMLWIAHTSFALLAGAAGAALLAPTSRSAGAWVVALLAWLPLLALHLVLASGAGELRFSQGIEHAPWLFAASLFTIHALGIVWLMRRAVSGGTLFGWSARRLAVGALVAGGFSFTTLRVLDLEARLALSKLRFEASAIAFEFAPAVPTAELNAAPVYEAVGEALFAGDDFVELDDYREALSNRAKLDADGAQLRRWLERCAPGLERVRAASALPYCRSTPAEGQELVAVPRVGPLIDIARLLCLEARVRAHQGNLAAAVDDVVAALRMSEQVGRMPTLIALTAATAMRTETLATLLHLAPLEGIDAEALARLGEPLEVEFASFAPAAIRTEEAFGLATLGAALADARTGFAGIGEDWFDWSGPWLYAPFMLDSDARGYRDVMAKFLALSRAPYGEFVRLAEDDSVREGVRRRGLLVSLMAPNMTRFLEHTHRGDAHAALTRLALAAARERLLRGSYPRELGAWSGSVADVRIEGDGATIRLVRTDLADPTGELAVSLPP